MFTFIKFSNWSSNISNIWWNVQWHFDSRCCLPQAVCTLH